MTNPQRPGADDERLAVARAICKSRTCEGFKCCQWPGSMGRIKCPVRDGGYNDAADAAIAEIARLRAPAGVGLIEQAHQFFEEFGLVFDPTVAEYFIVFAGRVAQEIRNRLADQGPALAEETARRKAVPAGGDLVERARETAQQTTARILSHFSDPIDDTPMVWTRKDYANLVISEALATFAATIQREAREAAIEECARLVDHIMDHGTKLGDMLRSLADRIAGEER